MRYLRVYDALIKVQTRCCIWSHHKSSRADAGVSARSVATLSSVTHIVQPYTLININTALPIIEEHVACGAAAGVGARRVDTEVVTTTIVHSTLIHIFTG